jgi:hypothetical protein
LNLVIIRASIDRAMSHGVLIETCPHEFLCVSLASGRLERPEKDGSAVISGVQRQQTAKGECLLSAPRASKIPTLSENRCAHFSNVFISCARVIPY